MVTSSNSKGRARAGRRADHRRPRHTPASAATTRSSRARRWAADGLCCALLLALCLGWGLSRYRNGIDTQDEGFLAYGAVRVLQGQLPNRDFVSLQPPLSFYTSAGAFLLLGTSLTTLRTLGLAIYTVIPFFVYAIARQRSRYLASLSAAVPAAMMGMPLFNFVPFAVWQGVAAALAAALLAIRASRTGRTSWAVFAGLATALTLVARHDQGVYVAVSVLVYGLLLGLTGEPELRRRAKRMLAFWAVGAAIPLSLLGAWWFASGALPFMFRQLVVFPLTTYAKTSSLPMPRFHSGMSFSDRLVCLLFYLPPIVDALVAVWLVRVFLRGRARIEDAHVGFLVVLSSLFYCQVLTRSDLYHLLITLGPWFVVMAWSMSALATRLAAAIAQRVRGPRMSRAVSHAARAMPLVVGAWGLAILEPVVLTPIDQPLAVLNLPRGGVRIDARAANAIQDIVEVIQHDAPADRSILSLPYSPMFYFLAERRNPTRWNYLWPGDQTPEDHAQLIDEARKDPPAVVTLMDETAMQGYAPEILDYVKSTYTLASDFRILKVYVRTDRPSR